MRTTVDIETPILRELREIVRREGSTLGALVSRLLAEALSRQPKPPPAPAFHWTARPMVALVDLADKEALHSILDRPDRAAEP